MMNPSRTPGPTGKPQAMLTQQLQMPPTVPGLMMQGPTLAPQQGIPPGPSMTLQQQQQLLFQRQQQLQQNAGINQPVSVICRIGAEYSQEIVTRTLEVVTTMRALTYPQNINSLTPQQMEEKKAEVKKIMAQTKIGFDRLRQMYDRCSQIDVVLEQGEMKSIEEIMAALIPFKEDDDESDDELPEQLKDEPSPEEFRKNNNGFIYRGPTIDEERKRKNPKLELLEQEYKDLLELNQLKSRQMKEIIDRLRKLVWDLNTMLAASS